MGSKISTRLSAALLACALTTATTVGAADAMNPAAMPVEQTSKDAPLNARGKDGGVPMEMVNASLKKDGWGPGPQLAAQEMMAKYGPPQELTPDRMIWHAAGPFNLKKAVGWSN